MSKGYPDFFGFSMFPFNGAVLETSGSTVIPASTTATVFEITTKGMIFAGTCAMVTAANISKSDFFVWIDGQLAQWFDLFGSGEPWFHLFDKFPIRPIYYNLEDTTYIYEFRPGITFGSSFKVEYLNGDNSTSVSVGYNVYHNQIQT